jgi:hypothetical protein
MISGTLRPAQRVQGIVSPWLQWFEIISVGFLLDGEYLHRQRDTDLMLSDGLVYRIGEKFWFRNHRLWRQSFLCEYRSKSGEFVLKSSVISALPLLNA